MRATVVKLAFHCMAASLAGCEDASDAGTGRSVDSYARLVEAKRVRGWLHSPSYLAAAGDPEDFLYRGEKLSDGRRDGDQLAIIEELSAQGVNGIYVQIIRSHGGDGEFDHNPFLNHDPEKDLNRAVLEQWEMWFAEMRDAGIAVLLSIYDDSTLVWDTGDDVEEQEREFVQAIVDRFEHFPNIIWSVAEGYQEALSDRRVSSIASLIAQHDDFAHPIAVHKLKGTSFAEFARDEHVNVFAMQLGAMSPAELNRAVAEAWARGMQFYNLIMSEAPEWGTGIDAQHRAWGSAFGGAHVMVYDLAFSSPGDHDLRYLHHLREFAESYNLIDAVPFSRIADRQTMFAMRDDGGSYYLYGVGEIGVSGIVPGSYEYRLFDPTTGNWTSGTAEIAANEWRLDTSDDYPHGVAIALRPARDKSTQPGVFPSTTWLAVVTEADDLLRTELESDTKRSFAAGCVVQNGRLLFSWGDVETRREWASAAKPLLGMLTGHAIEAGKVDSIDQRVVDYGWTLLGSDRNITFRHLLNMTSGYARKEKPGEAWAYNDFGIAILGRTLKEAFGAEVDEVFRSWLRPLEFEDDPGLKSRGGYGLVSSVRDVCRLGLLYLNQGKWGSNELMHRRIYQSLASPVVPATLQRSDESSYNYLFIESFGGGSDDSEYGPGLYGFGFWFNQEVPQTGQRMWPDLPKDTYHADGHFGDKHITIIPSMGVVIAGHSYIEDDVRFRPGTRDWQLNKYLARIVETLNRHSTRPIQSN